MRIRDNRDLFPPLRSPRPKTPFGGFSQERWRDLDDRLRKATSETIDPVRRRLQAQVNYHSEPVKLWYRGEVLSGKLANADVLIATTNWRLGQNIVQAIQAEGFRGIQTTASMSALGHLQMAKYQAAVIDIELPGVPGWVVVNWIRRRFPYVKLILLGPPVNSNITRAIQSGCFSYIDKPVDESKLITCLRNILYTRRTACPVERYGQRCDRSCVPEGTDLLRYGRQLV